MGTRFTRARPMKGGPPVILFPEEPPKRGRSVGKFVAGAAVIAIAGAIVWFGRPASGDYRVPPPLSSYEIPAESLASRSYAGSTRSFRPRQSSRPRRDDRPEPVRPARVAPSPAEDAAAAPGPSAPAPVNAPAAAESAAAPAPAPVAEAPPPAPGRLLISSMPWGRLYVDGQFQGNTPRVNTPVAAGRHRLTISREGYASWDTVIVVTAGTPVRLTDITLRPRCESPPC